MSITAEKSTATSPDGSDQELSIIKEKIIQCQEKVNNPIWRLGGCF